MHAVPAPPGQRPRARRCVGRTSARAARSARTRAVPPRSESGARCFSWAGRGASFSWAGRALVQRRGGGHSPSARAVRSASFLFASACPPSSAWSTSIASTGGCLGRSQPTRATETELQIAITVDQPALPARTPAEPPPRPSPAAPPPRCRACAAAPPPGARRRPASPPAARACAPAQRGGSAGRFCQLGAAGPRVQPDALSARGTLLGTVCAPHQSRHRITGTCQPYARPVGSGGCLLMRCDRNALGTATHYARGSAECTHRHDQRALLVLQRAPPLASLLRRLRCTQYTYIYGPR
jgi:hypothetical protein